MGGLGLLEIRVLIECEHEVCDLEVHLLCLSGRELVHLLHDGSMFQDGGAVHDLLEMSLYELGLGHCVVWEDLLLFSRCWSGFGCLFFGHDTVINEWLIVDYLVFLPELLYDFDLVESIIQGVVLLALEGGNLS